MNDHGDMPIDLPVDATTAWTTVGGNATKNQAPNSTPGQSSEKSNQNGQEISAIGNIVSTTPQPRRNQSLFVTRINFKVIPTKEIKTFSVPNSICRIVASLKAADKTARLIAVDEHDNEIEFKGATDLQKNNEANVDYVNQFIDEPKKTKSNQLVGLIILRSEKSFKEIKKNQLTQNGLNAVPRIYLTANYLDVVNPTTVGFFINTAPRADKPETFNKRFSMFMTAHNTHTKYQFEYGPIWAPNNRVSVFKLMAAYADKDAIRSAMENYQSGPNEDTYVCMTEYGSLPDAQKIKIIRTQAEYAANHRSLFIEGFNSISGKLQPGGEEDDSTDYESVAHWIYDRPTSYGERMFTRVYGAVDGVVELHAHKNNIKEATDWARLATKEIAGQLNAEGLTAVFTYPEEALDAMESLPAWKPHALSARVEIMPEPTNTIQQPRRSRTVTIDYSKANKTKKAIATAGSTKKATATKARNNTVTTPDAIGTATHPAWCGYGPPSTTAQLYDSNHSAASDEHGTDNEDMETSTLTPATQSTTSKRGVNKYKVAAEATEKRLESLEEGMLKLQESQQLSTRNIIKLAAEQRITSKNIVQATQGVDKLVKIVTDNKEVAKAQYEAATLATKETADQLAQSFLLMKALDSSMQNQRTLMQNLEARMKPPAPSPVRKKQINHLPTPPRKGTATKLSMLTEPTNTWEAFYDVEGNPNGNNNNEGNLDYSSDADMEGVAENK